MSQKPTNYTLAETAKIFQVARETIGNWIKEGLLKVDRDKLVTRASVERFKKVYAGKVKLQARANKLHKDEGDLEAIGRRVREELERETFDATLGERYERMLSESYKNQEGICYTPSWIVGDMLEEASIDDSMLFLDPCCGTGNFLLEALEKGALPQNLYGYDTDPNAILIAQRRIKEKTGCEAPHVVCADFLKECARLKVRFDLVFTNPPWGKKLPKPERLALAKRFLTGNSTDTSSLFLFSILSVLKPEGMVGMLMPESFFNIATYESARMAVLDKTILKIKDYGKPFKNMYSACAIWFRNNVSDGGNPITCCCDLDECSRDQQSFREMPKHILNYWTSDKEMDFLKEVLRQPYLTLKDAAEWGLGIVTGNNAAWCKHIHRKGYKPVYRGMDILPGKLKPASLYLNPEDFSRYQQMASLKLLDAPEKLIYRFISNSLVFYCDTKQRYILNSANMLVLDDNFPLSSYQLAGIMNSPLTNWLFRQLFHTHKVLKGDLEALPIITDSAMHRRFDFLDFDR